MNKIDCHQIVQEMRSNKYAQEKASAKVQAENSDDLWEKCVLLRAYTSPQSTDAEKLVKKDLQIGPPANSVSGDGRKNGVNYEIKVSVHDANCKLNIRQIRPHHHVDFYIIVFFNLIGGRHGNAHVFKIPSDDLYELVYLYGGYTHGTVKRNGPITRKSIKDKTVDFEYSLSADPNAATGNKSKLLWNALLKHEVQYKPNLF